METNKLLAGISYLSIFFAGFIFPLIVFLISTDEWVKRHAKKAFLSHLIPLVPVPFLVGGAIYLDVTNKLDSTAAFFIIGGAIFTGILAIVVVIWNIVKSIRVFTDEYTR